MSTKATVRRSPARPATPAAKRKAPPRAAPKLKVEVQPDFYVPENYQPEESVGYLMRRILNTVATEIEREMAPNGLTNAQWIPLFKLFMGPVSTVAELARECQLDAGAMTRLLDRLEAKGLLRRVRSCEDRRVVNLELTAEGRAAAQEIPGALCRVQNAHMKGFTHAEWETLKRLLRRILENALAIQADKGTTNEK
ncbi:MarR family winged helix-turn-helix transcriptional regulator [Caenimonas terrae]|uniref:MarR family winged helix-turn-helix transcriptional regulator n=1 Tax=Caenimonas terrae TaxID=696074 RepID=A0ABW0NB73_9BURK